MWVSGELVSRHQNPDGLSTPSSLDGHGAVGAGQVQLTLVTSWAFCVAVELGIYAAPRKPGSGLS
jgi:hypothetical protein